MKTWTFGAAAAVIGLAMAGGPANAAACFSEPVFTALANTFNCTTGPLTVTVTGPGNGFTRLDEGNGWAGEFVHGAPLYFDNGTPGAISLSFSSAFPAFLFTQADIAAQANLTGPYTATATAFFQGNLVGSDSYNGNNQLGPEGSIPTFDFSAFGSSLIDQIVYTTTNDGAGFAFGPDVPAAVPEPATWVLMMIGIGGLGVVLRGVRHVRALKAAV